MLKCEPISKLHKSTYIQSLYVLDNSLNETRIQYKTIKHLTFTSLLLRVYIYGSFTLNAMKIKTALKIRTRI